MLTPVPPRPPNTFPVPISPEAAGANEIPAPGTLSDGMFEVLLKSKNPSVPSLRTVIVPLFVNVPVQRIIVPL